MSGTKKDRESLKNRFKKGMYPTEDDFADGFESYVHKDDTIEMSKVVLKEGGETVSEVIDKKADKKTLDAFIEEVDTVLETVRDAETGEITKTVIQDLSKRIKDAEDDIADTSNTAEKNENAIAKILSILGKQDGETVSELAERFSALSGSYATVYAFVSKVKAFLESADASDETINRWQEIESFLQGITDKETLTGLLENLKTEIMQSIPKGNFMKLVDDLDAYTDASDGEIVKYTGQTNEKYTRGFDYERVAGEEIIIPQGSISMNVDFGDSSGLYYQTESDTKTVYLGSSVNGILCKSQIPAKGDVFYIGDTIATIKTVKETDTSYIVELEDDAQGPYSNFLGSESIRTVKKMPWNMKYVNSDGKVMYGGCKKYGTSYFIIEGVACISNMNVTESVTSEEKTLGSKSSWQHTPASPVIY